MAKLRKLTGTHEFSLENDPLNPTVIIWRDATKKEQHEFEMAKAAAMVGGGPVATLSQRLAFAAVCWSFAESLIVSVRGAEVEQDGAWKELVWPADKVAILELIEPGRLLCFSNAVQVAHDPITPAAYNRAVGARVVDVPNS